MTLGLITLLLLVPLLGAFAILLLPQKWESAVPRLSLGLSAIEFVLSTSLLRGDFSTAAYQFTERVDWIPAFGIAYNVGIDGISLWLVLLTTLLTPIALLVSWSKIKTRVKSQMERTQREYYLNEQMKAIQQELGDGEDGKNEVAEHRTFHREEPSPFLVRRNTHDIRRQQVWCELDARDLAPRDLGQRPDN